MGNHAKIVPKKIKIEGKEIFLEQGDFLIECTPNPEDIFLQSFKNEAAPACLIRIFRVEIFGEETLAI